MGLAATRLGLNLTDRGTLANAGPLTAGHLATLIGVARGAVTGPIGCQIMREATIKLRSG